jgi:hypothetical protein
VADRIPEPIYAKEFLENKLNVKTDAWDDLKHGEHSHAFTVAHSIEANVLDDIHGLLNKAMANGESFNTFKKGMLEMMDKHGWYGGDGHTKNDTKYINWRCRIIYDTNMKTAFAAGRERQQKEHADMRPIWVYKSKLVGKNRRQEHIALHDKAFPHDDPFWDTYYPPNEWGCECYVTTKSLSGAERDGIKVSKSDSDGNPPPMAGTDGKPIDWGKFAGKTWNYNPGRETLSPNFGNYKNLAGIRMDDGQTALRHVVDRYRKDMDSVRLNENEFNILFRRTQQADYKPNEIPIQVGNLDRIRHEAMMNAGIIDSKIMAASKELRHGTVDKVEKQKVPADQVGLFYNMFSTPEHIYENITPKSPHLGREFHFVKDTHDGKVLKMVFRQKQPSMALRLETIGKVEDEYNGAKYKKIF